MPYLVATLGLVYSLVSIWAMEGESQGTLMQWVYCLTTIQGILIFLAGMLLLSTKR